MNGMAAFLIASCFHYIYNFRIRKWTSTGYYGAPLLVTTVQFQERENWQGSGVLGFAKTNWRKNNVVEGSNFQ